MTEPEYSPSSGLTETRDRSRQSAQPMRHGRLHGQGFSPSSLQRVSQQRMSLIASPARLLTGPSLRERAKYTPRRNAGGKRAEGSQLNC